nr:hypothetical protein CFP56_09196 [Quercus suber]
MWESQRGSGHCGGKGGRRVARRDVVVVVPGGFHRWMVPAMFALEERRRVSNSGKSRWEAQSTVQLAAQSQGETRSSRRHSNITSFLCLQLPEAQCEPDSARTTVSAVVVQTTSVSLPSNTPTTIDAMLAKARVYLCERSPAASANGSTAHATLGEIAYSVA